MLVAQRMDLLRFLFFQIAMYSEVSSSLDCGLDCCSTQFSSSYWPLVSVVRSITGHERRQGASCPFLVFLRCSRACAEPVALARLETCLQQSCASGHQFTAASLLAWHTSVNKHRVFSISSNSLPLFLSWLPQLSDSKVVLILQLHHYLPDLCFAPAVAINQTRIEIDIGRHRHISCSNSHFPSYLQSHSCSSSPQFSCPRGLISFLCRITPPLPA